MKKFALYFVLLLTAVYLFLFLFINTNHPGSQKVFKDSEFRIAHRCGALLYPENTLFACKKIVEKDLADFLEMDVQLTKDNRLVVNHDDSVDRTTNGKGKINNFTLAELQKLDAGFHFTSDGKHFPFRGKKITLMPLAAFFEALPNSRFNIEVKEENIFAAEELIRIIRKYKMENQVVLGSFHPTIEKRLKELAPDVAFFADKEEIRRLYLLSWIGLENLAFISSSVMVVPFSWGMFRLTDRFIHAAHRQGIRVHVWTINTKQMLRLLQKKGVNGVMSDDPRLF